MPRRRSDFAWVRPERDERFHSHMQAAMAQGYEKPIAYTGIDTPERALDVRKGLFRAARHFKQAIHANVERLDDGTYQVVFVLHSKETARAYIAGLGIDPDGPYVDRRTHVPPSNGVTNV